jgi:hypothetical protein
VVIKGFDLLELLFGGGGVHLGLIVNIFLKALIIIFLQLLLLINLLLNILILLFGINGPVIPPPDGTPRLAPKGAHTLPHLHLLKLHLSLHSFDLVECFRKLLEIDHLHLF